MIKTILIAPYAGLAETARKMLPVDGIELDIKIANLENGIAAAVLAEKQGYELIISRGGTATMIQEKVSIPVVHIEITGYDMLRVFTLIREMKTAVALVGYSNVSEGAATICSILEYDVNLVTIKSKNEVRSNLKKLKESGCLTIIGDVITVEEAKQLGLRGILITSGKEALINAFEEGKRIHTLLQHVDLRFNYFQNVFTSLPLLAVIANNLGEIVDRSSTFKQKIVDESFLSCATLTSTIKEVLEDKRDRWIQLNDEETVYNVQVFSVNNFQDYVGFIIHSMLPVWDKGSVLINNIPYDKPIIGESEYVLNLRENIKKYSYIDLPICIIGERGTGKNTIAQSIHFERYGQNEPLVVIECSGLTSTYLDELYLQLNIIETSTILWKNIETLSISMQEKVITFVQHITGEIKMIFTVDISIHKLVRQELFNQDLYNMINKTTLHLRPLRERKIDIKSFIDYFIAEFHMEFGNDTLGMKYDAVEVMQEYDWNGNVYELKRVVKELSLINEGNYIEKEDVKRLLSLSSFSADKNNFSVEGTLKEIEYRIIKQVLKEEDNNQSKAAIRLNINRSTLWRKLNS